SRSDRDARETAEELKSLGADAMVFQADVADEPKVKDMVAAAAERYGRLGVLVNNAGTTHFGPHSDLDGLTDAVWDEILRVNLKGTFFCCRAAAPELRKTKGA